MAFFQDSRQAREPFLNAPSSVLWLIGLILAAHAIRVMLPGVWPDDIVVNFSLTPARYAGGGEAGLPGGIWLAIPFITYIFLHADLMHAGINSLWLLAFGPIIARRVGTFRFLLFFFFCGIAAAVIHLAVYWGSPIQVVGASGAVSGLMGGGMRIIYGRHTGRHGALAPILSKPILLFSAVWMIANVVGGVLRLGVTDDYALVAWVAHLGGYFTGLVTIGFVDRLPFGRRVYRLY